MRHHRIKITIALLVILLILISGPNLTWPGSAAKYHLDFLDIKTHDTKPSSEEIDLDMESSIPTSYPEPFIHPASAPHQTTLILLHGTSQDGPSFGEAFLGFKIEDNKTLKEIFPGTRFVFPTGKKRWCSVLGRESHAWFDFVSFANRTEGEEGQVEGLSESARFLGQLVEGEVNLLLGTDGNGELGGREGDEIGYGKQAVQRRIVIGGFSQGSAMACVALLSGVLGGYRGWVIGGFVGLSGWCPFRRQILDAVAKAEETFTGPGKFTGAQKFVSAMQYLQTLLKLPPMEEGDSVGVQPVPVFLGHGEDDMKMRVEWGREMGELLGNMGMGVQFRAYEGLEHWWNQDEMRDLVGFLREGWGVDE